MQDKSGLIRDRSASDQPYRTADERRSNQNRIQSPPSNTTDPQWSYTISPHVPPDSIEFDWPLVPLTIQIPKRLKAAIQRLAAEEGKSDSATARAFLARGVQANIDMQYGAMLRPVIEDQIHKDIQSYSNRNYTMNWQALYAAEQARILAIHTLRFLTDIVNSADDDPLNSPDELSLIIKVAQEEAWKNMTNLHRDKADNPVQSNKTATPAREEDNAQWPS